MILGPVNFIAIILATLATMALGFGWYMALGRQWMAALGRTPQQVAANANNQSRSFIIAGIMQLVMAYFLALLTPLVFDVTNVGSAMAMGFWLWLGFVITSMIVNHRYQGSTWLLTAIDGGYLLGVLLIQGLVIGLFG